MGRPKTFDETKALDRAMEVFWAKGYSATSMSDLLAATGLSKSSLYETFGNKHDLFLKTLERYRETVVCPAVKVLLSDAPAKKAIRCAFRQIVDSMDDSAEPRGCYSNNCAVEAAAHDPAACRRVNEAFDTFEKAFEVAICRGQENAEIPRDRDPAALARYLNATLNGLIVMTKTRPEPGSLDQVVEIALQALE